MSRSSYSLTEYTFDVPALASRMDTSFVLQLNLPSDEGMNDRSTYYKMSL